MNARKIVDWITYAVNMLVALPVFGIIGCMVFGITYAGISPPSTDPPIWAQWCFPLLIDLVLTVLWGRYQYRILILKTPRPPHETRRNLLILAGVIAAAFLLAFGFACYIRAERMEKAQKTIQEMERKKRTAEAQLKKTGDPKISE